MIEIFYSIPCRLQGSETEEDINRPDYNFRKSYVREPPPARFHAVCTYCSVQYDPRLGVKICRLCLSGPDFGERKWELESYLRPSTIEEKQKRQKRIDEYVEKEKEKQRKLYNEALNKEQKGK